jgi:uncharacterized phage protein (predicted DNA packaging)
MSITLEEVKKFIRVDGSFEDDVIQSLVDAAVSELRASGVSERAEAQEDYPLYELAVKAIVSQNYEGRGVLGDNKSIIQSLILKLKDYPAVNKDE